MKQGFAALLIIFILGMVSILVASGLILTGYNESQMARSGASGTSAFYVANAGVEEAIYRLNRPNVYGPNPSFVLPVAFGTVQVDVLSDPGGDTDKRIIKATGTSGKFVSKLRVEVQNTKLVPGFDNAIHAGSGGVEMDNNSHIIGNVYSNGSIEGGTSQKFKVNEDCHNTSFIEGIATASADITNLNGDGNGVCVGQDAYADNLLQCYIAGIPNSPDVLSANCSSPNTRENLSQAPDHLPLPDMRIESLKSYVRKSHSFTGDCAIGTTPDCYSIIGGVATVGNIYITGNLIKPNAIDLNFSGPVYVEGNIDFGSNSTVGLDDSIDEGISQITVAKGTITSAANITYGTRSVSGLHEMFLLFISDRDAPVGELCDGPSINLNSNSNSVLFYATRGCVSLTTTSSTQYHGAILGEKVKINTNSNLEYDMDLAGAEFGTTKAGGWQIASFRQD